MSPRLDRSKKATHTYGRKVRAAHKSSREDFLYSLSQSRNVRRLYVLKLRVSLSTWGTRWKISRWLEIRFEFQANIQSFRRKNTNAVHGIITQRVKRGRAELCDSGVIRGISLTRYRCSSRERVTSLPSARRCRAVTPIGSRGHLPPINCGFYL